MRKPKLDPKIFWPSIIIIVSVLIMLVINPEAGRQTIGRVLDFITHKLDSFFEWVVLLGFGWLMWIAFGRYGNIKLGRSDEKPEFSTISWIGIMITSGSGMALMYWACVEPVFYLIGPPFGIEPNSAEAAKYAITYGIFHWGFSAWALYCLPAVGIAYAYHVRKSPHLKASVACEGVLGKYSKGIVGKIIDIIILVGLVGGIGTSLGVVVPLMSACFNEVFGIQQGLWLDTLVIIIWTVMFGTTAYLGLEKGIKKLSDINTIGAIGLLIFILIVGPTAFLLSYFGESVGLMFQNFIRLSTYTDSISKSSWPQSWTVFYWAWWGVYAVYMGLFIARVSKGRTLKEMIIGAVIWPTVGTAFFYLTLGGYSIDLHFNQGLDMIKVLNEQGGGYLVVTLLKSLPLSKVLIPLFMVIGFIYQATTFQGAAYTLASMATDELLPNEQPAPWHRLFWAILLGGVGYVMMVIGGLKVVQLASVILAAPVFVIILFTVFSFMKWVKQDFGKMCAPKVITLDNDREEVAQE
ncbi:BCCT family transporter [Tepidibacter hydrothermalis]|uniref:BCCT family transporter n=1 Tax=Tepidibacter hydrothermalis TaxID=3036126 RepID=A0ABY8EF24_9FIRM|nr:BCCT family transporter [Tepidibacter hydrothermalis]WFD11555.1 BCCT family transporter [Tepidibacter hydrothermalis]